MTIICKERLVLLWLASSRFPHILQGHSSGLIGESDVMHDIFYKIEKIAPTDANILILGEMAPVKTLSRKLFMSAQTVLKNLM